MGGIQFSTTTLRHRLLGTPGFGDEEDRGYLNDDVVAVGGRTYLEEAALQFAQTNREEDDLIGPPFAIVDPLSLTCLLSLALRGSSVPRPPSRAGLIRMLGGDAEAVLSGRRIVVGVFHEPPIHWLCLALRIRRDVNAPSYHYGQLAVYDSMSLGIYNAVNLCTSLGTELARYIKLLTDRVSTVLGTHIIWETRLCESQIQTNDRDCGMHALLAARELMLKRPVNLFSYKFSTFEGGATIVKERTLLCQSLLRISERISVPEQSELSDEDEEESGSSSEGSPRRSDTIVIAGSNRTPSNRYSFRSLASAARISEPPVAYDSILSAISGGAPSQDAVIACAVRNGFVNNGDAALLASLVNTEWSTIAADLSLLNRNLIEPLTYRCNYPEKYGFLLVLVRNAHGRYYTLFELDVRRKRIAMPVAPDFRVIMWCGEKIAIQDTVGAARLRHDIPSVATLAFRQAGISYRFELAAV